MLHSSVLFSTLHISSEQVLWSDFAINILYFRRGESKLTCSPQPKEPDKSAISSFQIGVENDPNSDISNRVGIVIIIISLGFASRTPSLTFYACNEGNRVNSSLGVCTLICGSLT